MPKNFSSRYSTPCNCSHQLRELRTIGIEAWACPLSGVLELVPPCLDSGRVPGYKNVLTQMTGLVVV
jgi:hypothetical protein